MSKYPPEDVSPEDLWSTIIQTPRPTKVIDFPRYDKDGNPQVQLKLHILIYEDINNAKKDVDKYVDEYLRKKGLIIRKNETSSMRDAFAQNRYVNELLFRACRNVDDVSKPFFPSLDEIDSLIYPDESAYLVREFGKFQADFGPIGLTNDEMDMWIHKLIIGGSKSLRFFMMGSAENVKDVFNIPLSEITEGQILAWCAARKYYKEQSENKE
jgi:hypothetical protein